MAAIWTGWRDAVTADWYAILGVTPTSEQVVIHAAYRALMRHYHPDTNRDPRAQARAREINRAYAVLRDPAARAEYDDGRSAGQTLWLDEPPRGPPPIPARGRAVGIGAAAIALVLVGMVWAARRDMPRQVVAPTSESTRTGPRIPDVTVADLVPPAAVGPPPMAPEPVFDESLGSIEAAAAAEPLPEPAAATRSPPPAAPAVPARRRRPPRVPAERVVEPAIAALDRQSAALFSQSLASADPAQREQLAAMQGRFVAARDACRSDACITDAYLAHMREVGTVMQQRPAEPQ